MAERRSKTGRTRRPTQLLRDTSRQVNARAKQLTPQARTVAAKAAFLEAFRTVGIIGPAAAAAGIARQTVYAWQELDDDFTAAFGVAREEAIDALEMEARRRAVEGVKQERPLLYRGEHVGTYIVTEYSDRLLELLLKAARPEKYRERFDMTGTIGVEHGDSLTPEEREAIRRALTGVGSR